VEREYQAIRTKRCCRNAQQ